MSNFKLIEEVERRANIVLRWKPKTIKSITEIYRGFAGELFRNQQAYKDNILLIEQRAVLKYLEHQEEINQMEACIMDNLAFAPIVFKKAKPQTNHTKIKGY